MSLTYHARRRLRRSLIAIAVILALTIAGFAAWVIWADRYIVYTREGAKLDFTLSQNLPEGEPAKSPEPWEPVDILVYDPYQIGDQPTAEQTSISGYYIDSSDLKEDIPSLMEKLKTLPAGTAVLMDMKTIKGSFYYPTSVGSTVISSVDQEQMNSLLELLSTQKLHAIARIPAFRDWEYGLNNVPQGLPRKGGNGSLWMDEDNCYWLNPAHEDVLGYLIRIVTELKGLGFDEVVFSDFRFPDTDRITFDGNKAEALSNAASTLVQACATEQFFISFYSYDYGFPLPAGNSRLYLKGVAAADIPQVLQKAVTSNPGIQLLFQTEANDTRYNDYCVLRPLDNAIASIDPTQTVPTD